MQTIEAGEVLSISRSDEDFRGVSSPKRKPSSFLRQNPVKRPIELIEKMISLEPKKAAQLEMLSSKHPLQKSVEELREEQDLLREKLKKANNNLNRIVGKQITAAQI
jgi:hypothetical protein